MSSLTHLEWLCNVNMVGSDTQDVRNTEPLKEPVMRECELSSQIIDGEEPVIMECPREATDVRKINGAYHNVCDWHRVND